MDDIEADEIKNDEDEDITVIIRPHARTRKGTRGGHEDEVRTKRTRGTTRTRKRSPSRR